MGLDMELRLFWCDLARDEHVKVCARFNVFGPLRRKWEQGAVYVRVQDGMRESRYCIYLANRETVHVVGSGTASCIAVSPGKEVYLARQVYTDVAILPRSIA